MLRRLTIASLAVLLMAATSSMPVVRAQGTAGEVGVLESTPAAHAHIGRQGAAFFEVLFAAAPTLAPNDYTLHWAVITLQGTKAIEGDTPFKVSDRPPQ